MKPTLTDEDFQDAADLLSCDASAVKAVCQVEAPRGGFNPDDTPVTLFEGHKFHKYTGGKFDQQAPDLSFPKWTRKYYGKTWQAEQERLQRAMALDRDAALRSASWGKFQILGSNYLECGFETLQTFVNAMYEGEAQHLGAFVGFVLGQHGMLEALRAHKWADFARLYNGPSFAVNKYDEKLAAAFKAAI